MTDDKTTEKKGLSEKNVADGAAENDQADGATAASGENTANEDGDKARVSAAEESTDQAEQNTEAQPETLAAEDMLSEETQAVEDFDLNLLLDIPLEITVELGRSRIQIQELLTLGPGSTVTLSRLEGEPVDILANDKLIARGEVVLQNKKYGIRITEITSRMSRIKTLS